MRCPDCNKFVAFDENEPEVESLEVDEDGNVIASVRIVNACADCGTELKEATLEMESNIGNEALNKHQGKGHELKIEERGSERTQRSGYFKKGQFVAAFGRYAKTFYGAEVEFAVTCSCEKLNPIEGSVTDDVQASSMDEMT